jgi:hypothetical protein
MRATYTQGKNKIGQKKELGGTIAKGAPKGIISN